MSFRSGKILAFKTTHRVVLENGSSRGVEPRFSVGSRILAVFLAGSLAVPAQAGDILRGGTQTRSPGRTANGSTSGGATATRTQASAKDRLARTNQTLAAMRALQLSARNAGQQSRVTIPGANGSPIRLPVVPDGLRPGGLQVANGVPKNLGKPGKDENPALWIGANLPKETRKGGKADVTIVQTEQQALLNWKTFNVGKKTTLTFDQSAGGSDRGKWIAFNKINDPSGRPSQILGSIKADGQVYVINQNGIIFGGASQVNVHTLVASALPINDGLVAGGLLNNPTGQFLFNALRQQVLDPALATQSLDQIVDGRSRLRIKYQLSDGKPASLIRGTDFTVATDENRATAITFTAAGLAKLAAAKEGTLTATYTALNGDVIVQRGAQLSAPTTPQRVGGRIALVGANVRNKGTITTPDGQTILAGGLQIGMVAHPAKDPGLRGLDVIVGAVEDANAREPIKGGMAMNAGLIDAPRASVVLTGRSVQQNGVIDSTTSVSLNGRVDLLANYDAIANVAYDPDQTNGAPLFLYQSTGFVSLGDNSVIRILPEWSSPDTFAGLRLGDALRSQVNIQGLTAHLGKDSLLWAPNAKVSINTGRWHLIPGVDADAIPEYFFVNTAGQIYLDQRATIDVAGSTAIAVPLDQNILKLELRGSELADSPLQRDGALRGTTITIDARETGTFNGEEWIGTPLGDASGFVDLIQRTVGQLTAEGGSVDFTAGTSVVMNAGSLVDVSGGWVQNAGGIVNTTKLIQGNRLVRIADATPDQLYDGVYDPKFTATQSKWGITKTYRHALSLTGEHYQDSYIQGFAGGRISIVAPAMALDGQLVGQTVKGPRQFRETATSSTAPAAAKLELAFRNQDAEPLYGNPFSNDSPTPPRIVFNSESTARAAAPFALNAHGGLISDSAKGKESFNPLALRPDRRELVTLSPELFTTGGFGELSIENGAGDIVVPAGVALNAPGKGAITLNGRNVIVEGDISAPGGKLSFTANNLSPYLAAQLASVPTDQRQDIDVPFADPTHGRFVLGSNATLDVAGLVLDDRAESADAFTKPVVLDGGTVEINAYSANLKAGSLVDASGGVLVDGKTDVHFGDGGAITVKAGRDPNFASLLPEPVKGEENPTSFFGGRLRLAGELRGFSGAQGADLTLQAPFIRIGGRATAPGTLLLQPDFFNQGGFKSFALQGLGGSIETPDGRQYLPAVSIARDTTIAPRSLGLFVDPLGAGADGFSISRVTLPDGERSPVSLSFSAQSMRSYKDSVVLARGDLVMSEGAAIRTEPEASVTFAGDTAAILGDITAPAGSIAITGGVTSSDIFGFNAETERAAPTVYIGPDSRLSTAGTVVLTPNIYGWRVGRVLAGGSISVKGNIFAEVGSVLDVSGVQGTLDLSPFDVDPNASRVVSVRSGLNAPLQSLQTIATTIDGDAGSISLTGGEALFSGARLLGRAGGPSARGGSLAIASGHFAPKESVPNPLDPSLTVTQRRKRFILQPLENVAPGAVGMIGGFVTDRDGDAVEGRGYFAARSFLTGGFDSLELSGASGAVSFEGPVNITARQSLKVAAVETGGILMANDRVHLAAPYVALGIPFKAPQLTNEQKSPFQTTFAPTFGPGWLIVEGDLIDIGSLSLQNIGRAHFKARNGDIRGSGTLNIAGRVRFTAGQIYTPTAQSFTVAAYDYKAADFEEGDKLTPGSIKIFGSGSRPLPLSAGGTLSFYATNIEQGGVLRAPLGTINLGWDGTGTKPIDLITGDKLPFPVTKNLALGAGSVTSVSAIDPRTGEGALIPYGVTLDGNTWIDPAGNDITAGGPPAKNVSLSAVNVTTDGGSIIDLRGGGDLYAYRWVEGNGGTKDILASDSSFAVIPDYEANFAPYAPFNGSAAATNFLSDPSDPTNRPAGYVNGGLSVGDRVYLAASDGLAAGVYTLLPARYALLPGAVLVTPQAASPVGTLAQPDGSTLVSGYRFNDSVDRPAPGALTRFEVAPASVVRSRARYDDYLANTFIAEKALEGGRRSPLLPTDSGHLVFQGTTRLDLRGAVRGQSLDGGRGAFVDVSSPADIVIAGDGFHANKDQADALVLNASVLNGWEAESLLVGGIRSVTEDGTTISVKTGNLTVDNAGTPLTGAEIILAARENLTFERNAVIAQTGRLSGPAERLSIDGNGALARVSSDPDAAFARTNVTGTSPAKLAVGAGVQFRGTSLTLDSSQAMALDPTTRFRADYVSLNSGRISLQFDSRAEVGETDGLVLAGRALHDLGGVERLSLLSYSTIDIYGAGAFRADGELELHAGEIRGFGQGRGTAAFAAHAITLDNSPHAVALGSDRPASGTLHFDADTFDLGAGRIDLTNFARVKLDAARGLRLTGNGRLSAENDLVVRTASVTADASATHTIRAAGALEVLPVQATADATISAGPGASLTLLGANVKVNSDITLPSGELIVRATRGDVVVGGRLDVDGTAARFADLVKYTDAGTISLIANRGDIALQSRGALSLSAQPDGGNAGRLSLQAARGVISLLGDLEARAGREGNGGSVDIDVESLPAFAAVNKKLAAGEFDESRSFRVRRGDVQINGTTNVRNFSLSTDQGSIRVSGIIDASGETGGTISLAAARDLVLLGGSRLDASGEIFSNAGKGGAITLEAGAPVNGAFDPTALLDIRKGSTIDLAVDAAQPTSVNYGRFTGTLHLRAPQTAAGDDVQIAAIKGTIRGVSSLIVEGFRLYDLASTGGVIDGAIKNLVKSDGEAFAGAAGTTTAAYSAMFERLFDGQSQAARSVASLRPGAELFNSAGDVTLGTGQSSEIKNDWNFAGYRFGPNSAPGVLTLRASGNLVFWNALHDGFDIQGASEAYTAALLPFNPLLPMNAQSWSYRLVAGADLGAADFHRVQSLNRLGADSGSLLVGKNYVPKKNTTTLAAVAGTITAGDANKTNKFQVIRTGSGDIDIATGRDVRLLNPFATIYTAGTQVADATLGGTFDVPNLSFSGGNGVAPPVQYALGGGNVRIAAQNDIGHYTLSDEGLHVPDSQWQIPGSWLYRRGQVDPVTGQFGTGAPKINAQMALDVQSTTWWVDYTNFFEGVGALGGGNVDLLAGRDVLNVDAVAPTNARMPKGRPSATALVELGGGDVTVRAGRNIEGGTYYVERGNGELRAGNEIKPSRTRSFQADIETDLSETLLLPTTLFLGKGTFDVSARGNVVLGPVANPFLLPASLNNNPFYKTYFSTYAPTSAVNVSSLGGNVTLRQYVTRETDALGGTPVSVLQAWLQEQFIFVSSQVLNNANYSPWIRISETDLNAFKTVAALLPPTLRAISFAGDVNLVGSLTLAPAERGNLELVAGGSINGLQPNGSGSFDGVNITTSWGTSTINLSDASPSVLPGVATPFAYQNLVGISRSQAAKTLADFLSAIDAAFDESGATNRSLETRQALHDAGPLHRDDPNPVRLYANTGDISGLTLYSPKATRVVAGQDITDVGLYLQNVSADDVSTVSAGRDFIGFNANTGLRAAATAAGNQLNITDVTSLAGDIQLGGPGTLGVLAGRNLDLGLGPDRGDGTGTGITTIGNARNPNLAFEGASIFAGAGIGSSAGLADSALDFDGFIDEFFKGANAAAYLKEIAPALSLEQFAALPEEQRNRIALEAFYLVLRDAGRNRDASGKVDYTAGYAAIDTLFGATASEDNARGDINARSRDIRTKNGGSISIFTPHGELTLATSTIGNPEIPPGIITESGGNISIFADGDVDIGIGRIFTLRGGNMIIWSSAGDIAAGAASKTVKSAPPTRALIDPQSADVQTDLAGLSTGGGIGVLATVAGIAPGDVDLIAPVGVVDAGDAGIRVTGNLNIAATRVLNASNITVAGTTSGVPTAPVVAAPNIAGLTSASNAAGATTSAANDLARQARPPAEPDAAPSTITVEVLGYGGSEDSAAL